MLTLGLIGSLFGCSSSSSDAGSTQDQATQCKAITAAECKKVWTCESGSQLDASEFGTDEASCEKLQDVDCSDPMPCQEGYTWDFANGDECIKEVTAFTCAEFSALTAPPTACDNACKAK